MLLDFWATTCAPCVTQVPDLKEIYDAFCKDDRFVMLSLSMDTTDAEPKRFVAKHGIRWRQGFLDAASQRSVEREYKFRGIPQVLLIDPDGKVVATNLRGPKIREAVAKALALK